jgi:hypothetical protein
VKLTVTQLVKKGPPPRHLWKRKRSLPCSQMVKACTCPEPRESILTPFEISFNNIVPSHSNSYLLFRFCDQSFVNISHFFLWAIRAMFIPFNIITLRTIVGEEYSLHCEVHHISVTSKLSPRSGWNVPSKHRYVLHKLYDVFQETTIFNEILWILLEVEHVDGKICLHHAFILSKESMTPCIHLLLHLVITLIAAE